MGIEWGDALAAGQDDARLWGNFGNGGDSDVIW